MYDVVFSGGIRIELSEVKFLDLLKIKGLPFGISTAGNQPQGTWNNLHDAAICC